MAGKKKLLVFWSWSDFHTICEKGFLGHPDYEVELVSNKGSRDQQATYRRMILLARRVAAGEFDLIVANTMMRSPYPRNKGMFTTASLALRLLTYQVRRLDSWWAPGVTRAGGGRTPLAVVDARDSHYIYPWDWPLLKASRLYFKRELMAWRMRATQPLQDYLTEKKVAPHIGKLRPLSQGADETAFASSARPMRERDIDLFMSGGDNPLRKMIREKAEKLGNRFKVLIHSGKVSDEEYRESMQRSKLAVCVESWAAETWRQYEAAAAGSIPLLSWPYTLTHEPLEPDVHAFYFSYMDGHFERVVEDALSDTDRLQRMSEAARKFVLEKKGRRRLVNYVVETTLADLDRPGLNSQPYRF